MMFNMKTAMAAALAVIAALAGNADVFRGGKWREFTYDAPDMAPIVFSGASQSQDAKFSDYCLSLEILNADGTKVWGQHVDFTPGTHDWEVRKGVYVPKKPVKKIVMFALHRNGSGKAVFRDLQLERREGTNEEINVVTRTLRPFAEGEERHCELFNGRNIRSAKARLPASSPSTSPITSGRVVAWTADSMRVVSPLTFPTAEDSRDIRLDLARRERESVQVCLSAGNDAEWTGVTVALPKLKDENGRPFDGTLDWRRIGYLKRDIGFNRHPCSLPDRETWFPDPLMPPAPFRVRKGGTQGVWVTAYAAPDAKAGVYRGEIVLSADGGKSARVPVAVRVRDFALPKIFGLETAYAVMDGFIRKWYEKDFKRRKREAWDIMLDHRLNPDDISRTTPPDIEDLVYARSRGMNRFNVLNVMPPPKDPKAVWALSASPKALFNDAFYADFVRRARPCLAAAKTHGLDKLAYFYGFDECGPAYYDGMDAFWKKLKNDFPDVPLMSTAKNYRDLARGLTNGVDVTHLTSVDWFCPVSNDYKPSLNEQLRAQGKRVWWYTCCSPYHPYANMASWEYPPIEARLLGWMTHLYRADGYLFWIVNKWHQPPMDEGDTYFPEYRTRNGNGMPGDGILMYPGKDSIWPSIKLANCRDAVEDYEYLMLATKSFGFEKAAGIAKRLVIDLTHFSRDVAKLRSARFQLAEMLEAQ